MKSERFKSFGIHLGILLLVALIANHLTLPEHFPTHPDYEFPLFGVVFTLVMGTVIILMADICYRWFEKKYFLETVRLNQVLLFLGTALGIITIIYLLVYPLTTYLIQADPDLYYFTNGILVSLLISFIAIVLIHGQKIYNLSQRNGDETKLKVQSGNHIIFVPFGDIAYFHSTEKLSFSSKWMALMW